MTRLITWAAFLLATAATIVGNAESSYPSIGARIAASWAAVALLLAVAILERTPRPTTWSSAAFGYLGMLAIAVVGALVSYSHLHRLLISYHESALSAAILPVSVDGLLLVCSWSLVTMARQKRAEANAEAMEPRTPISGIPLEQTSLSVEQEARQWYLTCLQNGEALTPQQLGDAFGKSRQWSQWRIREALGKTEVKA